VANTVLLSYTQPHTKGKHTNASLVWQLMLFFIDFYFIFFKCPKRKKKVNITADSKQKRGHQRTVPAVTAHAEEVIVLEDGDSGTKDADDAAAAEEEELTPRDDEDDGRQAHDEAVLKTMRGQAICLMKDKGISISVAEENMALQLFPRVSVWFACGSCSNDVKLF
jgi:hypothetical protein